MESVLTNSSVIRIRGVLAELGMKGEIRILEESARTALEAASALNLEVGQIASSIVFKLPNGSPLLVITSGAHRVDTARVAEHLNVAKLHRADADYVKSVSGISIGGVCPVGWLPEGDGIGLEPPTIVIDNALNKYSQVWAAAGHAHAVFQTTFKELLEKTKALPLDVGE